MGEIKTNRSVCLRDVLEVLRAVPISGPKGRDLRMAADLIERTFGGDRSQEPNPSSDITHDISVRGKRMLGVCIDFPDGQAIDLTCYEHEGEWKFTVSTADNDHHREWRNLAEGGIPLNSKPLD